MIAGAEKGDIRTMLAALAAGASVNFIDEQGKPPIIWAVGQPCSVIQRDAWSC